VVKAKSISFSVNLPETILLKIFSGYGSNSSSSKFFPISINWPCLKSKIFIVPILLKLKSKFLKDKIAAFKFPSQLTFPSLTIFSK